MDLTAAETKPVLTISVRGLVEFVLRTGDLGGDGRFTGPGRALEGTRGHQRLQRKRPPGYQSEVAVTQRLQTEGFVLLVKGRVDGVLEEPGLLRVEEIKTVTGFWPVTPDPLHWAQGRIYAHMYLQSCTQPNEVEIQLTYLELDSDNVSQFRERSSPEELARFFAEVTEVYLRWTQTQVTWRRRRDESIRALAFPYARYRDGQRPLAVGVYRALQKGERLFVEAPTGLGKTMALLFPAIKVLGEGSLEKVFYLTAKTSGQLVAEKALAELRAGGLRLRSVTLTAREKICFNNGQPCDLRTCPYALGYYDRLKVAMSQCLENEALTRPLLEEQARRHGICPFALSLDLVPWVDAVVCDYNYVFDPKVYLKRLFGEHSGEYGFLVDEAHNLAERAREMFSAELDGQEIADTKRALGRRLPACGRVLGRLQRLLKELGQKSDGSPETSVLREIPDGLLPLLGKFLQEAEVWLVQNQPAEFREPLLEFYFRAAGFLRTSELFGQNYVVLVQYIQSQTRLRLYCLDPSALLRQALKQGKAAVFFSATLSPLEYFRDVLGGQPADRLLRLGAPFPREHLGVLLQDQIPTNFKERSGSYAEVAESIAALVRAQPGNYLAYFPSYEYLRQVAERFGALGLEVKTMVQTPGMSEPERTAFLAAFQAQPEGTLVGFAVMGGIFGEGIDLVGERLVGAAIVGVGLPQVCLERDLIRDYFQEKRGAGFDYAYTFPGLNRVLQAAGRVIRSEQDLGIILLLDKRFSHPRYRHLLPSWWSPVKVRSSGQVEDRALQFWAARRSQGTG